MIYAIIVIALQYYLGYMMQCSLNHVFKLSTRSVVKLTYKLAESD